MASRTLRATAPGSCSIAVPLALRRRPASRCLLGHMGGPFWSRKDAGAWTHPEGRVRAPTKIHSTAAEREFLEEIGSPVPATSYMPLGSVRQSGGKIVTVWAAEGDLDATATVSGSFTMEWPPRSGLLQEFPELDRTAWLGLEIARGPGRRRPRQSSWTGLRRPALGRARAHAPSVSTLSTSSGGSPCVSCRSVRSVVGEPVGSIVTAAARRSADRA